MPTITEQLSDVTKDLIGTLAQYTIEREYGSTTAPVDGARMLTIASLQFDLADAHAERGGQPEHLPSYAESVLRKLLRSALSARRCQCMVVDHAHRSGHDHIGACTRHYEADVPPLDGKLLCGTCYVATYEVVN